MNSYQKFRGFLSSHLSIIVIVTVAMMILSVPAKASAEAESSSSGAARQPLIGGVELDKTLPCLPIDLQVGKHADLDQLTGLTADNLWYPIPNWLGGKWHEESMLVTQIVDCKTGKSNNVHIETKASRDTSQGYQRDKKGQIWQYLKVPHVEEEEVDDGTTYIRVVRKDVIRSDSSAVVLKSQNTQITVDDEQRIIRSEQAEQIAWCLPIVDGKVEYDGSIKNFTADGAPDLIQSVKSVITRIAPYQNIDSEDGRNYKELFVEFLKKTGRQDLIPDGLATKASVNQP